MPVQGQSATSCFVGFASSQRQLSPSLRGRVSGRSNPGPRARISNALRLRNGETYTRAIPTSTDGPFLMVW